MTSTGMPPRRSLPPDSAAARARKTPAAKKPTKAKVGPKPVRRAAGSAKGSAPMADAATAREVSESAGASKPRRATKSSQATAPKPSRATRPKGKA